MLDEEGMRAGEAQAEGVHGDREQRRRGQHPAQTGVKRKPRQREARQPAAGAGSRQLPRGATAKDLATASRSAEPGDGRKCFRKGKGGEEMHLDQLF